MTRLTLIRGLPGSGKTTLAKSIILNAKHRLNWVHFEADQYFIQPTGEYNFDKTKLGEAHNWCLAQANIALFEYKNVIVSNTFTTKKELRPYFNLAKHYDIIPVVIVCQNQFESIHDVPSETLAKMKSRFQYNIDELFNK